MKRTNERRRRERKKERKRRNGLCLMQGRVEVGFYTDPFWVGKQAGSDSSGGKINLGKIDYTSRLIF